MTIVKLPVVLFLSVIIAASSFRLNRLVSRISVTSRQMCEVSVEPELPETEFDEDEPSGDDFFGGNKRVRLGRSRDQDGKSNIWSIEPKMVVDEGSEGGSVQSNLLIGGAVVAAVFASLPLLLTFSKFFPDPSDF